MTVSCPKCSANFVDKAHLKSHLDRKYPCTSGGFECNKCHKKFQQRCGRDRHQKRCLGIRETIESLKGRISTLEKDIKEPSNVLISDIKSVNQAPHIDQISNQVYFGIPGNLLKAVEKLDQEETLIKVGSSDDFPTRISRHKRDFGGFRLLDSVITNNPKHVEKKFKDWPQGPKQNDQSQNNQKEIRRLRDIRRQNTEGIRRDHRDRDQICG